jgi:Protein of unknown function (DUF2849)
MTSPLQQKLKVTSPVVITANRLSDGAVIYWSAGGHWTTTLTAARVVTTSAEAKQLLSDAAADDVGAIGAYVAPVELTADGCVEPANLRERIRLLGPTIDLPVTSNT